MSTPAVVLIVEDDAAARALLQLALRQEGHVCLQATTGLSGLTAAIERDPAVVLLNLGLPDIDGVEVTRLIREQSRVPIVIISARGLEHQKVAALDAGANDYLTKPFATGELLARLRVALRTTRSDGGRPESGAVTLGDVAVDFDRRQVKLRGREVYLTPIEYRLLGVMVRSAGQVLSTRQILRRVWGPRHDEEVGYLRVYMKKLRTKIEPEPARPRYLVNEPGVGYRFRVPD